MVQGKLKFLKERTWDTRKQLNFSDIIIYYSSVTLSNTLNYFHYMQLLHIVENKKNYVFNVKNNNIKKLIV